MQFLLLVYADEDLIENIAPDHVAKIADDMENFDHQIRKNGQKLGSIRLQPSSAATTVRIKDGAISLTEGPISKTEEQLGGIYIIEAEDQTQVLNLASQLPIAQFCSIEIRPILGIDVDGI